MSGFAKNGVLYPISGIAGENYSTDEVVIGKWIDGKPLYRKVINATITENDTMNNKSIGTVDIEGVKYYINAERYGINVDLSYLNIETISNIHGTALADYDDSYIHIPCYYNDLAYLDAWYKTSNGKLTIQCGKQYATRNIKTNLILEYTKTTD